MLSKLKLYGVAAVAAVLALLLAVIRYKDGKIADLKAQVDEHQHELNIEVKGKQLAAAKDTYNTAEKNFKDWQKENGQ